MADKKLKKKLAKMTEEQRIIFLEQMRLEEEEKQKQKEEMLSRYLKDKLKKEEQAASLNRAKLQNQWRVLMRQAKADELRKDIQILSQTFERVIDRKDAIIKSLARDIEEAEEQYQIALRSHLQNIDSLIDFQSKRIRSLEEEFKDELEVLEREFETERQLMLCRHEQEMRELSDIMLAMEIRFNERESEAMQEFQSIMDEIKNKNLEETHALRVQREQLVDELWDQFQTETQRYKDSTEDRKMRFEALKKKDEGSSRLIAKQMKRLKKLQDNISELKSKMTTNSREHETKIKQIKEDREMILTHFHELKEEMNKSRDDERARLTTLTIQSNEALKTLEKKKEKCERIMKLAEMCRKLETEEEKVLPLYASSLTPEEEQVVSTQAEEPCSEELAEIIHQYTPLDNFWKRYNKALIDKLALDQEREAYIQENNKLKFLLKQYLEGISVNQEVLDKANPLLIINQQSTAPSVPVTDPRVHQVPHHTVVEAAHIAKHILT
ncbi:dynein regulatory complex subunit 2-like [Dysidea avara]|uniref:dynein regulatory complex subunit 2-like n=1 Tax=Dysidea avara TaxID=196820 RepID=UPI0033249540